MKLLDQASSTTKPIIMMLLSALSFISIEAQEMIEIKADSVKTILDKEKDWVILDVRTPEEFSESHIPGAVNINVHDTNAFARIDTLKKEAKYIVYCRTRNRSNTITDYMVKNGFKTVYQMVDGIGGWNQLKKD